MLRAFRSNAATLMEWPKCKENLRKSKDYEEPGGLQESDSRNHGWLKVDPPYGNQNKRISKGKARILKTRSQIPGAMVGLRLTPLW